MMEKNIKNEFGDKYQPKELSDIVARNNNEAQKSFNETTKSIVDNPENGMDAVNEHISKFIKRQDKLRNDISESFDEHSKVMNKKTIDNINQRETPIPDGERVLIDKFNNLIEELDLIPKYKFLKRREKLKEVKNTYLDLLNFRANNKD